MKLKSIVSFEHYSLSINKKFFLSKYERDKGVEFSLHLYYICYKVYERILKISFELESELSKDRKEKLLNMLELSENRLQKLWGFNPDKRYHIYWKYSKKCSCSSHALSDGTYIRNYKVTCPIHSSEFSKSKIKREHIFSI